MGKGGSLSGDGIIKGAILIAGPTASGKSALALAIAERDNGIIVNANSMQVYSVLNRVTARPTAADQQRAPHELYGHVHPSVAYSTGAWLRDVSRIVGEGRLAGRQPIFVGGTGLYFRALVDGISSMPDDSRSRARPLAPAARRKRAAGTASRSRARRSRSRTDAEAGRRPADRARA